MGRWDKLSISLIIAWSDPDLFKGSFSQKTPTKMDPRIPGVFMMVCLGITVE